MAGPFDAIEADIAAREDKAARAQQPGSTLTPPPAVAQNPSDVLPGVTPEEAGPQPVQADPAPAALPAPAAPTAAATGPFDAIEQQMADQDEARFSGAIEAARTSDPDRYAEAARIAQRDGLDIGFVQANLDDLRARATANDMRKVLAGNDRLKRWFETGDNANAVKHDELHKLNGLGWLVQSTAAAWSEGQQQVTTSDIRFRQMFGRATPAEIKIADDANKQESRDYGAEGFFEGAPVALAKQLPQLIGSTAQGFGRAAYGSVLGTAAGAAVGSTAAGVGAVPGAIAGFGAGTIAGITTGRAEFNFRQEAGGAYDEFLRFKTDDGQSLDPDIAKGAAIVAGLANAGLETLGEAALERLVPGLDKIGVSALLKYGSREGIKAALVQPSVRAAFKAFGMNALRGGATEVATEVAQEAVTILAGTLAQKADGGEFQQLEAGAVKDRLLDTARETAQAMLILTPALSSSRLAKDVRDARHSANMVTAYQQANRLAGETTLRERAPERFRDAIKHLTEGGPSDTVYVNAQKMTELFQEQGLSPSDLDARIDGFSQRYAEAVNTGSDIAIPMEDYIGSIAGTPLGEALIEHQKWQPDAMTVTEANAALDAAREQNEALLEDALNAARDEQAKQAPAQQVFDRVYAQLVNIGESPETARTQAALARSFFGATAERSGLNPLELFERQGLEVRRAMPDGLDYRKTDELDLALDAVRRGDADRARRARTRGQGQTLANFLAGRGGLAESDAFAGELASRDLKAFKRGKLVGRQGRGLDIDSASLAAAEAGYFPDHVNEDGTIDREGLTDRFLSSLDEELSGRPQYTTQADEVSIDPQLARVETLADEMSLLGLDPAAMTNEEIRAELMKAYSPDATNGALFQFAGQTGASRSEGTLQGLARAIVMNEQGAYPDEVYDATGFFKGADGKWRFEIVDTDAKIDFGKFIPQRDGGEDYNGRLGDVLTHDKLFEVYPELRNYPVKLGLGDEQQGGRFYEDTGEIEAHGPREVDVRSVLLHEVAHAIQAIEGHARGGGLELGEIYEGENVRHWQELVRKAQQQLDPDDRRMIELQRGLTFAAQYEHYRRIAGEVEARNVQERDRLRQIIANPPPAAPASWTEVGPGGQEGVSFVDAPVWTQDVPDDQQIIIARSPRPNIARLVEPPREFFQTAGRDDLAGAQGDKRGSIQFQGDRTVINLFKAANLSTFLHESGHLYLEVTKQVAERDGAPEQVRKDWQTVLDYIGAQPGEAISREAHEKFAKSFETYLSEGRAPSEELRSVFERFKSWLLYVYRGAARAIGLPAISPEIRDVFDRMLATDAEIAEVQRDPAVRPMFKSAEEAGVSEAQWARMVRQAEAATEAAKGDMLARLVSDKRREQTAEWRRQKEATRAEVFDELASRPVYQVQHYIATGEILNSTQAAPVVEQRRLDRGWLVRRYGKDVLKRLPRAGRYPIYIEKGGLNPEEMADWFGYSNAERMVDDLMSAVPFPRAVVAETDARMRERNGDLLSNQAEMANAATEAFHNDVRGPYLEMELAALAAKAQLKAGPVMTAKVARASARELIRSKRVSDAGRVSVFARARDRAGKAAEAALLKGDYVSAVAAKRDQIVQHYLAIESAKARDEAEATRRYLDKFVSRKRPPGVDPDYLDQIDGVLEGVDLKASTSERKIARRKGLAAWMAEQEAAGASFVVPRELVEDAALKSYKDMTMEDFAAIRDIVKNIEHLGRLKNRILEKSRLRSFTAARDELVSQAYKTPTRRQIKNRNPSKLEQFQNSVAGIDAWLLKAEQIFQWLDMGDVNGPFTTTIFQRFVDAQNRKGEMMARYAETFNRIMAEKPKAYLAERLAVPVNRELSFTRGELYAIALNQGTESNRDKLLRGESTVGQGRSFQGEAEMNSALSLLTKEDWDTVQHIWDTLETLWPETAALERRITGVEPPKLERRKVETEHGTYAGGYYPIVYDPRESVDVADRAQKDADALFDNKTYQRPTVAHGFTKARVENYARPIKLDLGVFPSHVEASIHNITHREAVRDVLKFLEDKTLQSAIVDTMGAPILKELRAWLGRVASDRGVPPADTVAGQILQRARANISLYAMGWRVTTAVSQLAGWANAMEMVKAHHLAAGLIESMRAPRETFDLIAGKSGEMRDRTNNIDRDVRFALRKLEGDDGPTAWVKRHAFFLTAMADRAVVMPTWLGAYNQHLATYPGDETGAIRAGDRAVRLTQGGGGAKDQSTILGNSSGPQAILTMFYSYFNLFYNRLRTLGRDTRTMFRDGSYEDIPHLTARSLALVVLPALLADALVGKWPDGEEETWPWWAVKKTALYPLTSLPLARDIGASIDSGLGYQMSPLGRYGELTVKLIADAGKAVRGEDTDGRLVAKRAAELTGYVFGLPLGQAVSTGSNVWQGLEQGDLKLPQDLFVNRRSFGDQRDK